MRKLRIRENKYQKCKFKYKIQKVNKYKWKITMQYLNKKLVKGIIQQNRGLTVFGKIQKLNKSQSIRFMLKSKKYIK